MDLLEREACDSVTEEELCEDEDRHDRICKLYGEITDLEVA